MTPVNPTLYSYKNTPPTTLQLTPFRTGFQEGRISGGMGTIAIIGVLYAAGSISLSVGCIVVGGVLSVCVGHLAGGLAGGCLSKMWHSNSGGT
jgi:hypothetical protein